MSDHEANGSVEDRYRPFVSEPRAFRSRSANRRAALLLLGGILLVVIALALFA